MMIIAEPCGPERYESAKKVSESDEIMKVPLYYQAQVLKL